MTYDRRAASGPKMTSQERLEWVRTEVFLHREGGQNVESHTKKALADFVATFQSLHEMIQKQFQESKAHTWGGDEITSRDLEAACWEVIQDSFGEDPLAKMMVLVLSRGSYIY